MTICQYITRIGQGVFEKREGNGNKLSEPKDRCDNWVEKVWAQMNSSPDLNAGGFNDQLLEMKMSSLVLDSPKFTNNTDSLSPSLENETIVIYLTPAEQLGAGGEGKESNNNQVEDGQDGQGNPENDKH